MNVFSSTLGEKAEALAELASEMVVSPTTLVDSDGSESLVHVSNNRVQRELLQRLKIEVHFPALGVWRSGCVAGREL